MVENPSQIVTLKEVSSFLKSRPKDAHKGMFGHVLIIGGDYGMPGATRLAAEGALRIGAGLVTVVTRKAHISAVMSGRPEILCYGVESSLSVFRKVLAKATVVVLGSGLGQSTWSKRLFLEAMTSDVPMVIDADGLNLLAQDQSIPKSDTRILTPHPGEASRLLDQSIQQVQADRTNSMQTLAQRYGGIIVLKGSGTLIGSMGKETLSCQAGNPAMATAGMGDLLSGMIAGLLGQGLTPWQAAQTGVVLHATAADRVVSKIGARGLLASDLLEELRLF